MPPISPAAQPDTGNSSPGSVAKKAAPFGFQPEPLVAAVWKGTKAMVKNDGTETNDKRFWDTFAGEMGEDDDV